MQTYDSGVYDICTFQQKFSPSKCMFGCTHTFFIIYTNIWWQCQSAVVLTLTNMHTYIYTHVRMTLINDKTHFAVVTCSCSALILVATNRSLTASIAYSCFARLFIHLHCTYYIKYLKNLLYFISGSQCVIAQQIKIQQK